MAWSEQIYRYCERGADAAFWAEPLNAVTNAAFLFAAIAAAIELSRRNIELSRRNDDAARPTEWLLTTLVFVIGIGSFLFHTFATRWAAIADVAPIGIFMLAYFGYALNRFIGLNWLWSMIGIAAFIGALQLAETIECRVTLVAITEAARNAPCLNGTVGYLPAFAAMLGIGAVLWLKSHPAATYVLGAGTVFLASMFFRTVDFELCQWTGSLGTHFLWHILNATTLYLLLLAAIRHGHSGSHKRAIA